MRWILDSGKDIAVDENQIRARSDYIRRVTNCDVSDWRSIRVNGVLSNKFLSCFSNDNVDGVFITAHIGDVFTLCTLQQVCKSKKIFANTCIWQRPSHKELLKRLRSVNPTIELYFAKQGMFVDPMRIFRQSTTLLNVGAFGFQTSLSERELFTKRKNGLDQALRESFERVSPILMMGDWYGRY